MFRLFSFFVVNLRLFYYLQLPSFFVCQWEIGRKGVDRIGILNMVVLSEGANFTANLK
jgi:hypothetical protein